jgi:hypothetical protein
MPVIRNPQYYFREGFCWSDINTTYLKCRKKEKSINDVKSMSLYSVTTAVPEYFIICLINSCFMSHYIDDFVNNTQTFQINDARQIPIVVPSNDILKKYEDVFNHAIEVKKILFSKQFSLVNAETKLSEIQGILDKMVVKLYKIV